jgi:hypothetical protein
MSTGPPVSPWRPLNHFRFSSMRMALIAFGFLGCILILQSCSRSPDKATVSSQADGTWTFEMGPARLLVDPNDGAKDISLIIGQTEYIAGKDVRKEYYGSSLWIAPQQRFWPQPWALDFGPYAVTEVQNGIRCISQPDENGLIYHKEITADAAQQAFIHRYTISNQSDSSIWLAAWEVTRHHKMGMSLFPQGDTSAPGTRYLDHSIPMTSAGGMIWHEYHRSQKGHPSSKSKAIIDGRDGWIAYVLEGYTVLKIFKDVLPRNTMPGEQDVEIYVDNRFDYIEIEVLSEKTELGPGDKLEWQVEWRILEIPADMDIGRGSQDLPAFIQSSLE